MFENEVCLIQEDKEPYGTCGVTSVRVSTFLHLVQCTVCQKYTENMDITNTFILLSIHKA